jgi:FdhD protein
MGAPEGWSGTLPGATASPTVGVGQRVLPVRRVHAGIARDTDDSVAEEVPIALCFNGVSHAVMLATPCDLEDFALGFALTEGIVSSPAECLAFEDDPSTSGVTLHLQIAAAAEARLAHRRRSMAGRTGCGLCGTEQLDQVLRADLQPLPADGPRFGRDAISRAMGQFRARQALQQMTGAVHAAAWCDARGDIVLLREDVGRHNALDKLVGALARAGIEASTGFVAVTSRASFEMVQKTWAVGASLLAAVSAPTTLAVQTAQRAGVALIGFARDHDLTVYAHPQRVALGGAPDFAAPEPVTRGR